MKTLPGQELSHRDYAKLLEAVDRLIFDLVYTPIVDLVRPALPKALSADLAPRALQTATVRELHNAADPGSEALRKALRTGAVQMVPDPTKQDALFLVAKADRLISDGLKSFGARLNKLTGLWTCSPEQVPGWVRVEASSYNGKAQALHDSVKKLIDSLAPKIDELIEAANFVKAADHAITEVAGGWKSGAKKLEASWNLGPAGQDALAAAFMRSRAIQIKSPGSKVSVVSAFDLSTKREVKVWAQEALARLRTEVDENAEQGYRAEGLAERIRNEYGVSKSRADLIARQETNNFMAAYREARARDAGLKRYQWYCVRDARTRKDHLKLHGTIQYYSRPPITDSRSGARNNPGQDFRCLPGESKIEMSGDVIKAYRRWHSGELAAIITDDGEALRATPNHPVLTVGGWKPAQDLQRGDYLVSLRADLIGATERHVDHPIPTIQEIFDSLTKAAALRRIAGSVEQFHGDGAEGDVDVVGATRPLCFWIKTSAHERLEDILLPVAEESALRQSLADLGTMVGVGSVGGASLRGQGAALVERESIHADGVSLGGGTQLHTSGEETKPRRYALETETTGDGKLALAGEIGLYCEAVPVREVRRFDFSGHVFNLETNGGWYASGRIVTHNCRCQDRPVLE